MFHRVLIANRGEIAVRIARACRELGVSPIAVYSDADRTAPHVRAADAAYRLGEAPATDSYLRIDRVLGAARRSGAEAIHPGYGFLSESAELADACLDAGLVWIGPPPEAMRLLGGKLSARRLAARSGVPVVPGYDGDAQDPESLRIAALRLGFPLLVKASAGGGGRGMRLVTAAEGLPDALLGARREAEAAFGDGTLFLERPVATARHIEVQVLADAHGGVIHLGERECSVQRRRQKVIEESPAPGLTPALREGVRAAAVALARAAGYVNAGTVEFLTDESGGFYFLEVNARLQVEHPVTELVTGVDIVREQLRIAAGLPLSSSQDELAPRGHALECRLYAEDPRRGFAPSPGRLLHWEAPAGPGVRVDAAVATGDAALPHYDPLLAKLIVHAATRDAAIERAGAALRELVALGIRTNVEILRAVLTSAEFRRGAVTTDWLEDRLSELLPDRSVAEDSAIAAAGWQLTTREDRALVDPWRGGGWRLGGQERTFRYASDGSPLTVSAIPDGDGRWRLRMNASERRVAFERPGAPGLLLAREGDRVWTARVAETSDALHVALRGETAVLEKPRPPDADELARGSAPGTAGGAHVTAPMPGTVARVLVREGERVEAGQPVVVIEAMKMEHAVAAPSGGTVTALHAAPGAAIAGGAVLLEVRE